MALTDSQKSSRLFKKALGAGETLLTRDFFEEPKLGNNNVLPSQIWSDADSIPVTAPVLSNSGISGVVQYYDKLILSHIAGSNNLAYYHINLTDCIPFNYSDGSYNYSLFKNDNTPISFGQGDWLVDTSAGILTFYGTLPTNVTSVLPPKISFYKYVGNKGLTSTGDTSLSTALSTEIINRISGDSSLSTAILSNTIIAGNYLTKNGATINLGGSGTTESVLNFINGTGSTQIKINQSGLTYGDDYSGINQNNDRWLPDKYYVSTSLSTEISNRISGDTSLSTALAPNVLTIGDYLTKSGLTVKLGGSGLTESILNFINGTGSTQIKINQSGLTYGADYSSFNINNDRWIPDKGYISSSLSTEISNRISGDTSLSTALAPNVLTIGDFLTKSGLTVKLGGSGTTESVLNYVLSNYFNIGTGFNGWVNSIVEDSSGRTYIAGGFSTFNGLTQNGLIRLNSDGSKDTSFDIGTGFGPITNQMIQRLTLDQNNQKLYVGGDFLTFQDLPQQKLVRLNLDGSKDTSFIVDTLFSSRVYSVAIDSNNKIYAGGSFTTYSGNTQNRLIRLNYDGTKDTSFDVGTGFDAYVTRILIDYNNKILISGVFTSYSGSTVGTSMIRLNTDASVDTSFNIGTGFGGNPIVWNMAIDSYNKIYAVGWFTTFSGNTQYRLIRLNYNGSKDTTFNIGTTFGFDGTTYEVNVDSNNRIVVGAGGFTGYQGMSYNHLIRLNYDGSIDTTFDVGTGFDTLTYSNIILSNGKIMVGGTTGTTYQGIPVYGLAKINPNGKLDSTPTQTKINQSGLTYGADYAFINVNNDRWIPDKGYLNTIISTEISTRLSYDQSLSTAIVNINDPQMISETFYSSNAGSTTGVTVCTTTFGYGVGGVDIDSVMIFLNGIQYSFSFDGTSTVFHTGGITPTGSDITLYFNGVIADFAIETIDYIVLKYLILV